MAKKMVINGRTGAINADAAKNNNIGIFYDDAEARAYAYRKRNHHPTKGKRRVRGGYNFDYYV